MKKTVSFLLTAIGSVVFFANTALAARYEQNPDHLPSMGISVGLEGLTGTIDLNPSSPQISQDSLLYRFDVTLDLRMPLSERLTLFGTASFITRIDDVEADPLSSGTQTDEFGGGGRIGLRIYFPQ
jgi:hypothetical protein